MIRTYSVTMQDQSVGEVTVHRQGLYSRICCCCKFKKRGIYRLEMQTAGKVRNLGVLIPTGCDFLLETTIPSKYVDEEHALFYIPTIHTPNNCRFFPIEQGKSFADITILEKSVYWMNENQAGLLISNTDYFSLVSG